MHDNRWEGEKEEYQEKEDKAKREKPIKKKKEEEKEGDKLADNAKPPTVSKVESQTLILYLCSIMFVSNWCLQIQTLNEIPPSIFLGRRKCQRRG